MEQRAKLREMYQRSMMSQARFVCTCMFSHGITKARAEALWQEFVDEDIQKFSQTVGGDLPPNR